MRIYCNGCGKIVSNEVPSGTVLAGWVVCSECTEKNMCDEKQALELGREHESERYKVYQSCMETAVIDFVKWLYKNRISIIRDSK